MAEPQPEFYAAHIPENLLSRGTGERVPLKEATTFDVMPQLIGSTFFTNDELRSRVHLHGDHVGASLDIETVYRRLAEEELSEEKLATGGLIQAIDAYRRALHYATQWLGGVALLGGPDGSRILFTRDGLDQLNFAQRFANLEQRLSTHIWEGEVTFNPQEYARFVREVRRLEKKRFKLHQLFFFGFSEAFEPTRVASKYNPAIGQEYMDTCVAMNRFTEAAWIARELGWKEEAAMLGEKAKDDPLDHPRIKALIQAEGDKRDR